MKKTFILLLLTSTLSLGQQKYLVSPGQEIIPIGKHDRIPDIIAKRTAEKVSSTSPGCGDGWTLYGFPPNLYPTNYAFRCYGRDVLGQWYVAIAGGTIDTIYWYGYENNAVDSLVFLRIHESFIGPAYGPGVGIHANAPPCQSWGYWLDSNDLYDSIGIAAFPDDATDTTWYSTINEKGGTVAPTRPPVGYSKWGMFGIPTKHRLGLNSIAILDAGEPCSVQVGEKFFISFRINSNSLYWPDSWYWASFAAWGYGPLTSNDEDWPARNWKFYRYDSGASNCAGATGYDVKRGWVARGPFVDDQMYTAAYNFWYSMTVTTNVPPVINQVEGGDPGITFNTTGPYIVEYEIYDCDPSEPENAAVASAELRWSKGVIKEREIELVDQTPIAMTPIGGDLWEAEIPGQTSNTIISYRIAATDNKGTTQTGVSRSFRVYSLKQQYYLVDTGTCSTMYNIKGLGSTTEISYEDFFINSQVAGAGSAPRDNGTAGPFDIGGDMSIFGDVSRYAWVGVNGAIALSKSATDTIDVNSNGYWTSDWIFPYPQHHNRSDTINPRGMPPNFISPFWADFILADKGTTPATFGHIFYGNADDPCMFIVEWDSIGSYNTDSGRVETDDILFRVILNRCDGTIEYQYTKTGSRGRDATALVGLQADSSALSGPEPGWVFVNYFGQPYETKPRTEFCIKFCPGAAVFAQPGWNLLSVANYRPDMAKADVYPDAVSDAFKFTGSYVQEPVLVNGRGYWLKFDKYSYAGGPGRAMDSECINVTAGFNIIGSITKPVPVSSIVKIPLEMMTSDYFKYDGGYQTVTTLTPGFGFWVKVDMDGQLCLYSPEILPKITAADYSMLSRITVADRIGRMQRLYLGDENVVTAQSLYTGEMPPAAPEFDARFSSTGGMVVSYPTSVEGRLDYPISVTTDAYPITVKWEVVKPMVLYAGGKMVSMMEGSGALQLKSAAGLAVGIGSGISVPKVFALGQNYPNPFNPVTRFTVDVPRLADVQLAVYNVLGQKVRTLLSGETLPGSYEIEWDGTDGQGVSVPTGIYFIRIMSGNFSDIQKVVLIR